MNNTPEILVVDDIDSAAKDYAKLIKNKLGLNTVAFSDPDEATNAVRNYNIKVVILDQVMPNKSGNELLKEILLLKPDIKSLLLTGEASNEQLGNAINAGFNHYLGKHQLAQLCPLVLKLYEQYELDSLAKYNIQSPIELNIDIKSKIGVVKHFLISCDPIKGERLDNSRSTQLAEILAGEEKEYETGISLSNSLIIESSVEAELVSNLSLSNSALKILEQKLNTTISGQYKVTDNKKTDIQERSSRKIKLPEQPANIVETYITRRTITQIPYYQDHRIIIKSVCAICKCTKIFSYVISKPTGKYQLIQTDYLSDGSSKIIPIGDIINKI